MHSVPTPRSNKLCAVNKALLPTSHRPEIDLEEDFDFPRRFDVIFQPIEEQTAD
jgi:hypothetical protein